MIGQSLVGFSWRPPKDQLRKTGSALLGIGTAFVLALVVGAGAIRASGVDPLYAYQAMAQAAFGGWPEIGSTLEKATPLIFVGLATALAFRAGIINVGQEGQLYVGALAAAVVAGIDLRVGVPLHIFLALSASVIAGGLWGTWPGILRVAFGANEIVTTLMANYVAILVTSYLVNGPLRPAGVAIGSTNPVQPDAQLPDFTPAHVGAGFLIAVLIALSLALVFSRTIVGYEWKFLGQNKLCAQYAGISAGRLWVLAIAISGAICGVAGAVEVMGVQYRFIQGISPGLGYLGILVALIANNSPVGTVVVGILFGAITSGGIGLEAVSGVPAQVSAVIQGAMILLLSAQAGLRILVGRGALSAFGKGEKMRRD